MNTPDKSRCTCCHVCHTSEKTSRRRFLPCGTCQSIICEPCLEITRQNFSELVGVRNWSCPRCVGNCPCKRCKNKRSGSPSDSPLPKRKRTRPVIDETNILAKHARFSRKESLTETRVQPKPYSHNDRISELKDKNHQCIEYILRTEKLLALIRSEQDRIATELSELTSPESPLGSPDAYSSSSDVETETLMDEAKLLVF